MVKAALYARVSSDRQDTDLSIAAQLRELRAYAEKNDLLVVREFIDEAETGRTTARPSFKEMISLARHPQKPFEMILVWKYSRFARSRQDSIVYKAMLRKNGVQVVSITEPLDDTPTGRLLEAIIESIDEYYSDNLGEDVTRGMRESASRGFYLSSKPPYGYRKIKARDGNKERTKLGIDPSQAGIVSSIFNDVLQGKGLVEIAKDLNKKGIKGPKGNDWNKTGLYSILTNEISTGTFIWGRRSKRGLEPIRVENVCPAIVSRETFNRVQALMKQRSPIRIHPKRAASSFLLSGLTRCGYCGRALVGQDAKNGKFSYYVCGSLNKKGAGSCPARYLNSRKFEDLVIDKIKERILTTDNLKCLVDLVNEEMDNSSILYRHELETIQDQIIDANRRLNHLYEAIETGNVDLIDLAPRIRELRGRQEKLQTRKAEIEDLLLERQVELASPDIVAEYIEDMRNLLSKSSLSERKTFIRSFIEEIKVTGGEVLLTYTLPMPPQGHTEEKIGVLPTVRYSGR